jgi:valyl-tRNA synthetase
MPDDPVEKFLAEEKARETQRHELIKEVLRQKEAAIKAFDDKLEKLGYDAEHEKRSHHPKHNDKKPE